MGALQLFSFLQSLENFHPFIVLYEPWVYTQLSEQIDNKLSKPLVRFLLLPLAQPYMQAAGQFG